MQLQPLLTPIARPIISLSITDGKTGKNQKSDPPANIANTPILQYSLSQDSCFKTTKDSP
jgi:hypothetical protein